MNYDITRVENVENVTYEIGDIINEALNNISPDDIINILKNLIENLEYIKEEDN